jgi:hypothetical protein
MDAAVSPLPSVPSCTRRTLPVIYFLLDFYIFGGLREVCLSRECTSSSVVL